MLKDKKILLIAPKFYEYENEIIKEIKNNEATVDYISLFPQNNVETFILRIIKRFCRKSYNKKMNNYFIKNVKKFNKKYDFIFVISGETLDNKILKILNNNYKEKCGETILYLWTPISRYKEVIPTLIEYDKIFSFDKRDCEKYNFIFRPNFYSSYLETFKNDLNEIKYKLFFLGMYRNKRYRDCRELEKKVGKNFKYYLYFNRLYFYIGKLRGKIDKNISYSKLESKSISRYEMYSYFSQAKAIFDESDLTQNGLTQRIFDGLKLEKKIITTNLSIKEYEFYNKNNIFIISNAIEDLKVEELESFFNKKYKKIEAEIIEKYSLKNWIKEIFGVI